MKHHVHSLHCFTRAELQASLQEASISATLEVWEAAVKRVKDFESYYWSIDNIHKSVKAIVVTFDTEDEDEDDFFPSSDEEENAPFHEFCLHCLFNQHVSSL